MSIICPVRAPHIAISFHFKHRRTALIRWVLWLCLLFVALEGRALAQGANSGGRDGSGLPPAPQNHVLDEAGLFREKPSDLSEIQGRLRKMQNDHGYPVYLAIYYNVYDGNMQARADALLRKWTGEANHGMVIVYQLDPVVSGSNPVFAYHRGSTLDDGLPAKSEINAISGQDVGMMLTRVFRGLDTNEENHVAFISSLVTGIAGEVDRYYEVEPVSWTDKNNLYLMAVFLGIIVALALLGMLFWKLFTRADERSSKSYYLPEVRVGRRLGAPFGGGWVSEKTFVPASSRR